MLSLSRVFAKYLELYSVANLSYDSLSKVWVVQKEGTKHLDTIVV